MTTMNWIDEPYTRTHTHTPERGVVSNRRAEKHMHGIPIHTTHRERARQLVVSMPPLPTHMLFLCGYSLSLLSVWVGVCLSFNTFLFIAVWALSTHRLCCHMQSTEFARKSTSVLRLLTNHRVGCTLVIDRAMLLNTKIQLRFRYRWWIIFEILFEFLGDFTLDSNDELSYEISEWTAIAKQTLPDRI